MQWEQLGSQSCPGDLWGRLTALCTHLLSAKGANGLVAPSCLKTQGFPAGERHLSSPL